MPGEFTLQVSRVLGITVLDLELVYFDEGAFQVVGGNRPGEHVRGRFPAQVAGVVVGDGRDRGDHRAPFPQGRNRSATMRVARRSPRSSGATHPAPRHALGTGEPPKNWGPAGRRLGATVGLELGLAPDCASLRIWARLTNCPSRITRAIRDVPRIKLELNMKNIGPAIKPQRRGDLASTLNLKGRAAHGLALFSIISLSTLALNSGVAYAAPIQIKSQFIAGGCRGGFTEPDTDQPGVIRWGAFWQCVPRIPTQIQMVIQECLSVPRMPPICSDIGESEGPIVTNAAYFSRSDAYHPCVHGATETYRPVARHLEAGGITVPDVYGNPVPITCR